MSADGTGSAGAADEGYPQDVVGWPSADECANAGEYPKELATAKVALRKQRAEQEMEHAKAVYTTRLAETTAQASAERELWKAYYDSVFGVAKGSIDRARSSAELVQKAAAAIVTIYTGVLALTFSVGDNPLTWRGVITAFFLGLAIVLSTGYLAYLPSKMPKARAEGEDGAAEQQDSPPQGPVGDQLAAAFIAWSWRAIIPRAGWLRASVVSLGVALFFLPVAFIELPGGTAADTAAWPALAQEAPANVDLQKIVYAAQVAEVAKERSNPRRTSPYEWIWGVLAALGLVTVFVVPAVHSRHDEGTTAKRPRGKGTTAKRPPGQGPAPLPPTYAPEPLPPPEAPEP